MPSRPAGPASPAARPRCGRTGRVPARSSSVVDRDVLELERHHVDGGGERVERGLVVIVGAGECGRRRRRPGCRARVRRRGSDSRAGPPPAPSCGRAGRRPGCRSWRRAGSAVTAPCSRGVSATASVCRARHAARRVAPAPGRPGPGSPPRAAPALMAPGSADRQRADRHAAGHLDDRVEAVDAAAGPRFRRARPGPAGWSARRSCPAGARPRRHRR